MTSRADLYSGENGTEPDNSNANNAPVNLTRNNSETGSVLMDKIGFEPEPNILSEYHQPSYYFRFFLMGDINPDPKKSVTIAETGTTGINIKSVSLDCVVGPNLRTKNTIGTNVVIKIFEPYAATLPDLMFWAANKMKIVNHLKASWYLELKFRGYDSNGVFVDGLGGGMWRWKLIITDIKSDIDHTGALHTITAVPTNEQALENSYERLSFNASVGGETVGEVLKNVIKKMNEDVRARNFNFQQVEYSIEDVPYEDDMSSVERPFDHRIVPNRPQNNDERNSKIHQFPPGSTLSQIVDTLFGNSTTAVEQLRNNRSINSSDEDKNGTKNPISVFHRVETFVENIGYNHVIGEYQKKIKFVIRPYTTVRMITDTSQAVNYEKDIQFQRLKAEASVKKMLLSKQYDYIFTGKNTEVIKFDISVNFRWAVSVPMLLGRVHYGTKTVPREINETIWLEKHRELNDLINRNTVLETTVVEDEEENLERIREIEDNKQKIKQLQNSLSPKFQELQESYDRQYQEARKAIPTQQIVAEDEYFYDDMSVSPTYPITINQNGDDKSLLVGHGVTEQANEGKSIYGILLNQLYGTMDGNLQSITLTIRGDPYWLGPPQSSFSNAPNTEKSTKEHANFMNGEHMFIFKYQLPRGYDESDSPNRNNANVMAANEELKGNTNMISGFFSTIKVTHNFDNGMYTQNLEATRIPGWTVDKIINDKNNIT